MLYNEKYPEKPGIYLDCVLLFLFLEGVTYT